MWPLPSNPPSPNQPKWRTSPLCRPKRSVVERSSHVLPSRPLVVEENPDRSKLKDEKLEKAGTYDCNILIYVGIYILIYTYNYFVYWFTVFVLYSSYIPTLTFTAYPSPRPAPPFRVGGRPTFPQAVQLPLLALHLQRASRQIHEWNVNSISHWEHSALLLLLDQIFWFIKKCDINNQVSGSRFLPVLSGGFGQDQPQF